MGFRCRVRRGGYKPCMATLSLLVAVGLIPVATAAPRPDDIRQKIQAAFLYNFFNYIKWPEGKQPGSDGTANICVYGDPDLEAALRYVELQKASERSLKVISLKSPTIPDACHVVFISRKSPVNLADFTHKDGVLLVSDTSGFTTQGGMIELVEEEERMSLYINNTQLTEAGFNVSSRLLGIAKKVN